MTVSESRVAEAMVPAASVEEAAELVAMGDRLCRWAGHLAAAEARWLVLLAEFDRRWGWAEYGCRSAVHWLSWKLGIEARTAHEKLRVAHALEDLPVIRGAFERGELTYSKVRAVTRIATPATDADLAASAKVATAAHLERLVRGHRANQRWEDERDRSAERPEPFLRTWVDEDGFVCGSFRLAPDDGAVFDQALQAHTPTVPAGEDRPEPQRAAAAALAAVAEASLAATDPLSSRFLVTVHVDAPTLAGEDTARDGWTDDAAPVPAETVRRLACDAKVNRVVWGPAGELLDVGHDLRVASLPQHRALRARDGGCRFPGCDRTRRLRAHHLLHWADGGPTDLANLVLLCPHHHRQVHEGGWDLRGRADEALVLYDPQGRPVMPGSVELPTTDPDRITAANHQQGLAIDAHTATSTWLGERCDYDTWITNLLHAEHHATRQATARAA